MRRIAFLIMFLLASAASAQPSSVTGTVADGETITINGTSMGSYAAPWYFEDFEGASTELDTTISGGINLPHITALQKVGGNNSLRVELGDAETETPTSSQRYGYGQYVFPEEIDLGDKLYYSYWFRWDFGAYWCDGVYDQSVPYSTQIKFGRVGSEPHNSGDSEGMSPPIFRTFWVHTQCDVLNYHPSWSAGPQTLTTGGTSTVRGPQMPDGELAYDDEWHHMEIQIEAQSAIPGNGTMTGWMARRGLRAQMYNIVAPMYEDSYRYSRLNLGGWQGTLPPPSPSLGYVDLYFDNLYVNNGWQRVVIGDAPTYDGCYIREPQPYTSWTANAIEVGPLVTAGITEGQTAYFYVVDEDGVASAALTVTIGGPGGGEPGAPGAPTNLTATEID